MMDSTLDVRPRKTPFATQIDFTAARLNEEAARIQALCLTQVEYSCKKTPGLKAVIYGGNCQVTLYSRYCLNKRPVKERLGILGLITLEQARQKHRANRALADQGIDPRRPAPEKIKYNELHEKHYLVQCRSRQKKSIAADISRHDHWLGPEFGDEPLKNITVTRVNQFILRMEAAGLAPATRKKIISQLGSVLNLAVDLEFVPKNVVKSIRLPRVHNRRTEFLTVTQLHALYHAATAEEDLVGAGMIKLMALTGARLGEVTQAKHEDFDLDRRLWRLPTQKSGRPGEIFLSAAACDVVRLLQSVRRNAYLCPGEKGNPTRSRPIKLFRRLCQQAGIPESFCLHDLRHAWVSAGIAAGIPLEIMSQGARHQSPGTTRLYSHVHASVLIEAQETIGRLVCAG